MRQSLSENPDLAEKDCIHELFDGIQVQLNDIGIDL